jgi:hypothetical protein
MKLDQIFKLRVCRPNGLIKNIVLCCIMRNYRDVTSFSTEMTIVVVSIVDGI